MLEKLFKSPDVVARHKKAPYVAEREIYLKHCAQQGFSQTTLGVRACELRVIACELSRHPELRISPKQIEAAANRWARKQHSRGRASSQRWSCKFFIAVATQWLRFLGRLREPAPKPAPFTNLIKDFSCWMERERAFSPETIKNQCHTVGQFLNWYELRRGAISEVRPSDIDAFLKTYSAKSYCRASMATIASRLRCFFRYAAMRRWCRSSIADAILGPRLYAQADLPSGPAWKDVMRLLASTQSDSLCDIRDRPILLLFAIYGFRRSEVSIMRLEDIGWMKDQITVTRPKQRRSQTYPLIPAVGNAIIRYLQKARPQSSRREIFLTLRPPFRPISPSGLYALTCRRMATTGIRPPHRGPHSLRHACAAHLVAKGLSLKEIGDHLGNRSASATQIYAKVDLKALREVAAFDLGGLL